MSEEIRKHETKNGLVACVFVLRFMHHGLRVRYPLWRNASCGTTPTHIHLGTHII
jgi:hypothetical protein